MSNSAVYFRGNEATALTPFIVLTGFGTFAALIGLGVAVRRTSALPSGYGSLPLAMGLAAIPLLMLGAALEGVNERLFEVPIALLGLGWVALGRTSQLATVSPPYRMASLYLLPG